MDIKNLDKIIQLCRKRGVAKITIEGVTIELGDAPSKESKRPPFSFNETQGPVETDGLSDMDLLMWSSQSHVDGEDKATSENK